MKVLSRKILDEYCRKHSDAKTHLDSWYYEVENEEWKNPHDVKTRFAKASIIGGKLIVFDIKGGNYRLVVKAAYNSQKIVIKWFGTHKEYDKLDLKQWK
ncbi:MAG TPA: type II toxin-antitoxin system HigB family toxin [Ignavibacteria bacterium]|nr:type II toxin-antitoxin system HigB family toxin [Melioribacteraceae bacterium]HET55136.1 type II toxin-antitoxin system HigB family toxin [Ignavibacteria bacterium]